MGLVVSISDLHFSYPGSSKPVLNGLNLEIEQGEYLGLLGPNGAGKTTLLSFVCGQRKATSNNIKVLEDPTSAPGIFRGLGFCPQDLALFPTLSAYDNMLFFAKLAGVPKAQRQDHIMDTLEFVDLSRQYRQRVFEFSGGMKRRLNLAVALLNHPKLLILDEPTVGVDIESRDLITDKIKELKKSNMTLIYTTHYMEEVERLCNSIALIQGGKIVFRSSLVDFKGQGTIEQKYKQILSDEGQAS